MYHLMNRISQFCLMNASKIKFQSNLRAQIKNASSYEGSGRTTVDVINRDSTTSLMINTYSSIGFRLSNDFFVMGPIILFPKVILSWRVSDCLDINDDSLHLFHILQPKVDVLILGLGDESNKKLEFDVHRFIKKTRTTVEVLDTPHAISTYNFLCNDGRNVAAALIPPMSVKLNDDDMAHTQGKRVHEPFV